ncbi:winged helix-turn-helix domain-containing protein [Streptomyces sp. Je 1-332]|uniref:winged helix-turn-helix domain-containing protein n=1 Tax=Streptomyces sp. Je 1-332 TaxID=3231270 RepID=UPI003458A1E3
MSETDEWMPNPRSRVYVYAQIAEHICEQIRSGALAIEDRLDPEPELAHRYEVGINTLRRAIRHLREQGIVETVPAKGTFVIAMPKGSESK